MSLLNIITSDYGNPIELTFIDVETDAAADISAYVNTIQMLFTSPAGVQTTKTATFKTNGTDGIISYTPESGFLTAGDWKVRGRVAKSAPNAKQLSTMEHLFTVLA